MLLAALVSWGLAIIERDEGDGDVDLLPWLVAGSAVGLVVGVVLIHYWRTVLVPRAASGRPHRPPGQLWTLTAVGAGAAGALSLAPASIRALFLAGLGTASLVMSIGLPSKGFDESGSAR